MMLHRSKVGMRTDDLIINVKRGIAYQIDRDNPIKYDVDYMNHYKELDDSKIGKKLLECRIELVEKHAPDGDILDIGVGSGIFLRSLNRCYGYDINTTAVKWLKEVDKYLNPY